MSLNSLTWDGNTACLPTSQRKRQRQIEGVSRFDFDALKVPRGGLLEAALHDLNLPINAVINSQSLLMLQAMTGNAEALSILGAPAQDLGGRHILRLYELIEDHLENKATVADKNTASTQYRFIFSTSSVALGNGEILREIAFRSRFISTNNIRYRATSGPINETKLILVDHDDEDALQEAILTMMKGDLKKIEEACWDLIDRYKQIRDRFVNLKNCALSDMAQARKNILPGQSGRKSTLDQSIAYKLAKLHSINYSNYDALAARINWSDLSSTITKAFGLTGANNKFDVQSVVPELGRLLSKHELFYVEYFMPTPMIDAGELLFLIYTGWNTDTVISITPHHVRRGDGYFDIHSVKSKNNQTHGKRVFRKEHPRFYELIDLLLRHNENVDRLWRREDPSLFVAWSTKQKQYKFRVTHDSLYKKYILTQYGLPDISKKDIRDQVANIFYLETNDVFKLKELLGHADVLTTLAYLNQHAIRILNEANMRRFMDRLGATIVWAVEGDDEVRKKGLSMENIDRRLLFPVGDNNASRDSVCDNWLKSVGEMKFTIGPEEIEHLNWQTRFYRNHSDQLKQNNPKAYLLNHVPRMLFCAALREVIAHSPYSKMLISDIKESRHG